MPSQKFFYNHVTLHFKVLPSDDIDIKLLQSELRQKIPHIRDVSIHIEKYWIITIRFQLNKFTKIGKYWQNVRSYLNKNGLKIVYEDK
jgi:hypothetical protein